MRSVFRIGTPAYTPPDDSPESRLASMVPQMPTLSNGAYGQLNFQAQSPQVGQDIINSAMDRQSKAQQAQVENARWAMGHMDDLNRFSQYGQQAMDVIRRGVAGQMAVPKTQYQAPQVPDSLKTLAEPLGQYAQAMNENTQKTWGNYSKAHEMTTNQLQYDPKFNASVSMMKETGDKKAEIAAQNLPQAIAQDQVDRQQKIEDAVNQSAALGQQEVMNRQAALGITGQELGQKNRFFQRDRDAELATDVRRATALAQVRNVQKMDYQKSLEDFNQKHPKISMRDLHSLQATAIDQLESRKQPYDADAIGQVMESLLRTSSSVQNRYQRSNQGDPSSRRFAIPGGY
jgi:hypothetical protein